MAQLIIGIIMIIIGIVGGFVAQDGWKKVYHKDKDIQQTATGNDNTEDETARATEKKAEGIRARMCDIISGEFKRLIKKQVDPWIFYNSKGVNLKKFDDKNISMSGGKYNNQSKAVFLVILSLISKMLLKER